MLGTQEEEEEEEGREHATVCFFELPQFLTFLYPEIDKSDIFIFKKCCFTFFGIMVQNWVNPKKHTVYML